MNSKIIYALTVLAALQLVPITAYSYDSVLILTPDEYVDELQPLRRFKECSARPAYLLTLSQVYGTFSGVDNPERIKQCIAHYQKTKGITSAMLVGDIDKFPVRWRWWGRWMPDDPYFKGNWSVVNGQYRQSNLSDKLPFCSWVDIGSYTDYTV